MTTTDTTWKTHKMSNYAIITQESNFLYNTLPPVVSYKEASDSRTNSNTIESIGKQ